MGVPCDVPDYIKEDNQYALVNTTVLDYTLKKNNQIIDYHF